MTVSRFAVLLMAAAMAGMVSCTQDAGGVIQQPVTVSRGNLTVTVSGSGALEAILSRRLTFATAGQVERVYVTEGQRVGKGDRIAGLSTDALELAISQAEVNYAQALAGVTQSEAALKAAELSLSQATGRITVAEVEAAQADLDSARAYVQYVLSNMTGAAPEMQASWANALAFAQAKLAAAEAKFNALTTNTDTDEIAVIRLQVNAAQESADLSRRSVTLARQTLEHANRRLEEATLLAPFDGLVARMNVKESDAVSPAVTVAEILDTSGMQLEVQVDEIDVVEVKQGQKALLEVDALPDITLEGQVIFVSPVPDLQSGVVVYRTRIGFAAPETSGLRVGMSASADIVVAERSGVLLVPDRAIGRNERGSNVVKVVVDGQTQDREIEAGISDGILTEVLSGLREGETIIVERANQQSPGLF